MIITNILGTTATLFGLAACVGNPVLGAVCVANALLMWRFARKVG
jgi:hypothetical protein